MTQKYFIKWIRKADIKRFKVEKAKGIIKRFFMTSNKQNFSLYFRKWLQFVYDIHTNDSKKLLKGKLFYKTISKYIYRGYYDIVHNRFKKWMNTNSDIKENLIFTIGNMKVIYIFILILVSQNYQEN